MAALEQEQQARKTQKSLYYSMRSVMGDPSWQFLWACGARGRGKSFAGLETICQFAQKYGQENVKVYYFRISDLSIKKMLENGGAKAVDALLVRKYNLHLTVHGNCLYNEDKPFITFYPLVSAAKAGKGIAEYDPEFLDGVHRRYVFMIIDEFMMAEGVEKKSVGNPVDQFKIYYENILRDQERLDYPAVRIMGFANAVSECSDFLAQLAGFIPEKPGRYRLKRKHMIIDWIANSEAYIEKRKKSYGADIMDYENDSNYTNIIKRDVQTLKPKNIPLRKIDFIIKFAKDPQYWFVCWDGGVIARWNKQEGPVVAMKRYLDTQFNMELVQSIFDRYDARAFLYTDLITQATFAAQLKLLKSK